ncbi:MAG: hypothetical protein WCK63_13890 [Betaproteobacteria bacterium]
MPLPASLIASIVSAVIEAAAQSSGALTQSPQTYETYVRNRVLPPEAKTGVMLPPAGNGWVTIDGQQLPLSPTAQFRNQQNLIIMAMSIQGKNEIVYLNNTTGAVWRIWLLNPSEVKN